MMFCRVSLCNAVLRSAVLYSILVGLLAKIAYASDITSLNFTDSALNNCVKTQATTQGWQQVNDIKKLKCHGMGIKNAEGIQALTQLTQLSLYNNKLEKIDLRKLKLLENVNIANNKLHSVEVSELPHLHTLYLFKNRLSFIDFTGLIQLKKIRITNNQLKDIDISPLLSLEKAYFFDNKLEELVVKGLPKLKFIELRQNPMPDEVYDRYDAIEGITIVHDGNADDWK